MHYYSGCKKVVKGRKGMLVMPGEELSTRHKGLWQSFGGYQQLQKLDRVHSRATVVLSVITSACFEQ
ncbi:hypothetical protein AQUCO_01500440v1 [Aquilegia coerulea]|uniref:Uncharacterized protein n=1 Tax=Aquilegia coerulea TaxID=218851 RepID=A0A2G5DTR6_AQUCA|nr:hypothetical protein AQUCO_01500440v1 [Aquilegia coerulea]